MNLSFLAACRIQLKISIVLFLCAVSSPGPVRAQKPSDSPLSFEDLVTKMSTGPGNACNGRGKGFSRLEYDLFWTGR
jgi:hypothetical protein